MHLPPLKQLISELEIALAAETRPTRTRVLRIFPVESRFVSTAHVLTEEPRRAIVAWPQVSHPAVVRAWLRQDAVIEIDRLDGETSYPAAFFDGLSAADPLRKRISFPACCDVTLADPEAAGWALAAARALRDGAEPDACEAYHCDAAPDDECRRYVRMVVEGVRG